MRFRDKSVVITGAAGGFGRRLAERLAAEGARLALADIDADGAEAVVRACREIGAAAFALRTDVSREADVASLVAAAVERHGGLDIAFNNAGIGHDFASLSELSVDTFDRVMAVNARGVFLGMKHQIPAMLAGGGGGGVILNTSSAAGLIGAGTLAAYAASKHAVVGLTRAAADEVARRNIRINAICPSFAATAMLDEMAAGVAERHGEDRAATEDRLTRRVPMGRVARVEEVVEAMLWLVSPENTFMTGQAIAVDGGLTAV
jgi:NAD(P)-dependent dehydrogenase (short-subunit alcohol dehydrogenase family)